jgi:hypothetical protein
MGKKILTIIRRWQLWYHQFGDSDIICGKIGFLKITKIHQSLRINVGNTN